MHHPQSSPFIYRWYLFLSFPVMGVNNYIVLPTIYINPIKKSPFLLVKSIEPPFFIVKSHEIHHCFYHSQSWQPQFMMPKSPDSGWYKKLISTRVECPKGSWEMMVKNGLVSENCRIRYHNINHWFCDI